MPSNAHAKLPQGDMNPFTYPPSQDLGHEKREEDSPS